MGPYQELFRPGRIGRLELRNRLVMPPMTTAYADNGWVNQRLLDYYEARARGGIGMIIVESNCVEAPRGWRSDNRLRIDDDKFIPGLRELTTVIHRHGAKAAQQLSHGGKMVKSSITGCQAVGPSPTAAPGYEIPHELTVDEIKELVGFFARAAERARRAGYDGVEVHAAHAPLVWQFLSPAMNLRRDEYGGSLENRARLLLDIMRAIRQTVGPDFPIWCRINGEDGDYPGSTPLSEVQALARLVEGVGADAINVSGIPYTRPGLSPAAYFARSAAAVKKAVKIPVINAGGVTAEAGEKMLREGQADFIGLGRAVIADPDFPNKLAAGKLEDIRPCIRCLECINTLNNDKPIPCSVNASNGREGELTIAEAKVKKKVLVIGGGPAGMEAARVSALRGHKVTLWEKADRLGGNLIPAGAPGFKREYHSLADYLSAQIKKLGVTIELGKEATAQAVLKAKPDAVLIATGGSPLTPPIPGINGKNVTTGIDVLTGARTTGGNVVIIGGGLIGGELALHLAQQGKSVTVVEILGSILRDMHPNNRQPLLKCLEDNKVKVLTDTRVLDIKDGLVTVSSTNNNSHLKADTVVVATGMKADNGLAEALKGKVAEVYSLGDCVLPRRVPHAISEGYRTARLI